MDKIVNANCLEVLPTLIKGIDNPIIVTDPPFNIGYRYDCYKDSKKSKHIFTSTISCGALS